MTKGKNEKIKFSETEKMRLKGKATGVYLGEAGASVFEQQERAVRCAACLCLEAVRGGELSVGFVGEELREGREQPQEKGEPVEHGWKAIAARG